MFSPGPPRGGSDNTEEENVSMGDYLLEVLEMAMNRDPDQDFELWLFLERDKEEVSED